MTPTPYSEVNEILATVLAEMQRILGARLVGLYLYGSLVTGDFDSESSDIDLLAATSSDLDNSEFDALHEMQDALVKQHKRWEHRIEIAYLSVHALQTFKSKTSPIAIISPGEPFHIKEAGIDWLTNWYIVREKGVALFGPPPTTIIDSVSKAEFITAVREHAKSWSEWVHDDNSRQSQAYTILTLCRAFYTTTNGEQVSKKQAALWAAQKLPEWASLINNALAWRAAWRDANVDHAATMPETVRFVDFAIDRIVHDRT